jgi:hypothetical protein
VHVRVRKKTSGGEKEKGGGGVREGGGGGGERDKGAGGGEHRHTDVSGILDTCILLHVYITIIQHYAALSSH